MREQKDSVLLLTAKPTGQNNMCVRHTRTRQLNLACLEALLTFKSLKLHLQYSERTFFILFVYDSHPCVNSWTTAFLIQIRVVLN